MKTRNITPVVMITVALVWIVTTSTLAPMLLPTGLDFLVGVGLGVSGVYGLMWLLEGDRIWITGHDWLPFWFILKPRGFYASTGLGGINDADGGNITCKACGNTFEEVEDHFRSDSDEYCPDCSRVGEIVMQNYKQWFSTTEDVQEMEASD